MIIDESTGQITQIRDESRYLPEQGEFTGKQLPFDANREIKKRNKDNWLQQLTRLNQSVQFGESELDNLGARKTGSIADVRLDELHRIQNMDTGKLDEEDRKKIEKYQASIDYGQAYLKESYRQVRDLFDKAWIATENQGFGLRIKKYSQLRIGLCRSPLPCSWSYCVLWWGQHTCSPQTLELLAVIYELRMTVQGYPPLSTTPLYTSTWTIYTGSF